MKPLRANQFMADRGARLGGFPSCPGSPLPGQVRTAPVEPPPSTGAGVPLMQGREAASRLAHNQENAGASPAPATRSEEEVAPATGGRLLGRPLAAHGPDKAAAETAPVANPTPAGAVTLSDASAFILSLVAAHEGRRAEDVLAQLIAAAAEAIGIHSLIMRDAGEVDLADLPDFALRAANRFRGGGP